MDMKRVFLALPPLLVLLPSAISCYYTMKNQLRYTLSKTMLIWTYVNTLDKKS